MLRVERGEVKALALFILTRENGFLGRFLSIHVQYCQLDSIGKNRSSIRPIRSIWRIEKFLDDLTSRVFYRTIASH